MAKKGKYAHVINTLPKFPGEVERRDIVEAVKQEIKNAPALLTEHTVEELVDEMDDSFKYLVDILKRETGGKQHAAEFGRVYAELRSIKDMISSWESDVNLLLEAYQWLMIEQMEVEGLTAMRLANGQPVSTFDEPYAQVVDKEAFRRWCMTPADECMVCGRNTSDHEHERHEVHPGGGLERAMSLPWSTTNALTKERLLAGEEEPDGVTCFAKTKVRLGAE